MIAFTVRFPLGVYHALGVEDRRDGSIRPEWPPSPVRLVGALLAAAHEVPSGDVEADRAVIEKLCGAAPPTLRAPTARPFPEQPSASTKRGMHVVAELRGASRWAPRNLQSSELKALSPRVLGTTQAAVDKGGVAVGDFAVVMLWTDLALDPEEFRRLRRMASDVAWIGTSRSPATVTVDLEAGASPNTPVWDPLAWDAATADAHVRVPTPDLLRGFDNAYAARRSAKDRVEPSGQLRPLNGGRLAPYAVENRTPDVFEPEHWGTGLVVGIDESRSELLPRTPATYLVARAFRTALMGTFEDRGGLGEAPSVLHGRGEAPHLAIVPLPFVGDQHADGGIRGLMLAFPHRARLTDVALQRHEIESALAAFMPDAVSPRFIQVPGAGRLFLRPATAQRTLSLPRYGSPSTVWASVTPVIHSRWRHGSSLAAIERQVIEDCAHVELPEPVRIDVLRGSGVRGGAHRLLTASQVPPAWRTSLNGPMSHLRIEFAQPVRGPILLGRARHFGVGLFVPQDARRGTR